MRFRFIGPRHEPKNGVTQDSSPTYAMLFQRSDRGWALHAYAASTVPMISNVVLSERAQPYLPLLTSLDTLERALNPWMFGKGIDTVPDSTIKRALTGRLPPLPRIVW